MTDKIEVKKHSRRKPGEKVPDAISDPQMQPGERGVQIVGGGDQRGKGDPAKTMQITEGVKIVRRSY